MTGRDSGYLSNLKGPVEAGMTMAASNWGTDWNTMKWLDSDTGCQGDCTNNPTLKISNIATKSNGHPDPPKHDYDYGDPCSHPNDGKCGNSCSADNCRWSWPHDDPAKWDSKDAACRCRPGDMFEAILL